ncbi:MAG: transporter substrate-binding domain-containing protein [Oscillospiraceae bacterium]
MKKLLILLLAALVLVGTGTACAGAPKDDGVLTVAMELAYPPFETKDQAGNPSGISVDFAKAFGEYLNQEVRIENISFDGLIPSLQTGKADMVMSSMTIREDRKESVDFSDPYANAMLAVLGNKTIEKVEDLNQKGKKIAVKTGSTGFFYAKEHLANAEILTFPDESACVTEVAQGKADGFIYDQLTVYRNWMKNKDTTTALFLPSQDVEKWGIAVQKGNTALLTKLNEFLAQYTKDGGFEQLTEKYLSEEKKAFDEFGFQWFFDLK